MEHRRSQLRMGRRLKIMQEQVGHEHSSTTSIYTCVSSDFRTRTLRRHLDATVAEALERRETRG
jgi:integrase/recombinase XerC